MNTFAQDYTLPSLPIPTLSRTCGIIPGVVAPLVEPSVLAATEVALEELQRPGGDGEKLQQALQQWAERTPDPGNWLEALWEDQYKSWREPIAPAMNFSMQFAVERWGKSVALPKVVCALARIFHLLAHGEVEPERRRNGRSWSMSQARRCLYTRIPGPEVDSYRPVDLFGWKHIAITCYGHWFVLNLMDPDGNVISETALAEFFATIRKKAAELPQAVPVAAMTSMPRAEAAELRFQLQRYPRNRLTLEAIESSLFTVSLDPPLAPNTVPLMHSLTGDAGGRWFDKSLQLISTEDGQLGACLEHGQCDGSLWNYLFTQMDAQMSHGTGAAFAEEDAKRFSYYRLDWNMPPALAHKIRSAGEDFARRAEQVDCSLRAYPEYGLEFLKHMGTNPDTFFQIVFQVAQFSLFGKLRSAYQAVSMRGFCLGRTTRVRPCSMESLKFIRALRAGSAAELLLPLYRRAENAHLMSIRRSMAGRDVERHLLGLQAMYAFYGKELGLERPPALFSDPGWLAVQEDMLFFSTVDSHDYLDSIGTTHTHRDGFGVFYLKKQTETVILATSFTGAGHSTAQFFCAFEKAAKALADMLQTTAARQGGQCGEMG